MHPGSPCKDNEATLERDSPKKKIEEMDDLHFTVQKVQCLLI